MKKQLLGTIMALVASTSLVFAESNGGNTYQAQLSANSASQAVANSNSSSGAIAQGGSVTFNTPASTSSRVHQTISGTQTIKSAPQVAPPSMSSGHPCAWAPLSVGISVVGFGGALGGQRIDDACLLGQMQYRDAAVVMIAQRNPAACRALEAAGNIRAGSCGGGYRRASAPVYAAPVGRTVTRQRTVTRTYASNGTNCRQVFATAGTTKKVCS